jgi:hypothetical protein
MKIGMLTFHHVYNFGALLQAYAMQKALIELGHSVEVVDVRPFYRHPPFIAKSNRYLRPFMKWATSLGCFAKDEKTRKFDGFRGDFLNISQYYKSLSEIFNDEKRYDALVVGSDQVWNAKYGKTSLDTYFTRAARGKDIRRVGYAVCSGTEFFEEKKLKPHVDDMLNYDSIGVRDGFTKNMIKVMSGRDVDLVVDPTLLIDWDDFGIEGKIEKLPQEYIFYYGFSKNGDQVVKKLSGFVNLPVVNVGMEVDGESNDGVSLEGIGPIEWVEAMRRSSYVVTKSFHGVMLALALRKPVLIVPPEDPSSIRLTDAAARFGVTDAVLPANCTNQALNKVLTSFDWVKSWKLVSQASYESREFLRNSLYFTP